jgi:hypothetical protein
VRPEVVFPVFLILTVLLAGQWWARRGDAVGSAEILASRRARVTTRATCVSRSGTVCWRIGGGGRSEPYKL